jgi:hypothetical protein
LNLTRNFIYTLCLLLWVPGKKRDRANSFPAGTSYPPNCDSTAQGEAAPRQTATQSRRGQAVLSLSKGDVSIQFFTFYQGVTKSLICMRGHLGFGRFSGRQWKTCGVSVFEAGDRPPGFRLPTAICNEKTSLGANQNCFCGAAAVSKAPRSGARP